MVLWGKIAILRNVVKQGLRNTDKSAKRSSSLSVMIVAVKGVRVVAGRTKSEIERRGRGLLITWILVVRVINYTQSGSLDTTTSLHEFSQVETKNTRALYALTF
jgi:hypothetical protein